MPSDGSRLYKLNSGEEIEIPCSFGFRLLDRVSDLESWRVDHSKEQREDFETLRSDLKEALARPPAWVTAVVAVLTCIIGALGGALAVLAARV